MEVTIQNLGKSVTLVASDEYTKDTIDQLDPISVLIDMAVDTLKRIEIER